jgi:autotransporter-associated beta strand protein
MGDVDWKISFRQIAILLGVFTFIGGDRLVAQSFLMDFGTTLTTNPNNGLTWNNYTNNVALNLVTAQGNSTAYYFTPNAGGSFNTGFVPSGANLSALGAFNHLNAASDAVYTTTNASYYLYNINPNLTYDFTLLGSRDNGTTRVTTYTAQGSNTGSGSVTTSGANVGGSGVNYNNSSLVNITGIASTNFGGGIGNGIQLTLSNTTGGFAYLNAMSVEGYIGYLNGASTTLNGAPAAGYVANGTYANGDSRSVSTVIGGGSTVTVNNANGIYYNSTLIVTNGGGTVNAGANFEVYKLEGAGNLNVGGDSQLLIGHSGGYSGNLNLNGGTLRLAAANAIGTGNISLNGGTLNLADGAALGSGNITVASGTTTINNVNSLAALTGNNGINLNGGTFQVNGYGQILNLGSGNVSVTGTNNLNAWSGGMRLDGTISGSGLLNWYGGGSMTLGGANTFSGTMSVAGNNGTFILANTNALQNATLNKGAAHTLSFGVVGDNTYNLKSLTGSGDINLGGNSLNITNGATYSGNLSGTGRLRVAGETTLSGSNSFSGGIEAVSGQLNVNSASALGTGTLTLRDGAQFRNSSGAAVTNIGNNAMILNGTNQFTGGILDMGTGTVTLEGTSRLNTTTGNLILGGNLNGSSALAKDGIGTLTLAGSNSATSMVVVDYGTLALANTNALANANLYVYGTTANKKTTFAMAGNNDYNIGELSGTSTGVLDIGGNTVTLGGSGRSGSFAGQITGSGGNLTKAGAGTVTLTGTSDYTGQTTVTGGKLVVNGSLLQSAVTVQAGATLGGSGTVGALTVDSGGTLAVGNSPGLLTAASATWNPGSTFQFEIANATGVAGTDWDLLSVSGNLNLTTIQAASKMNLLVTSTALQNYNFETSYSWVFAQAASISADGFSWASGLDVTDWFAVDSTGFNGGNQPGSGFKVITGTDGGFATLSLQAVPEPSSASLILIGLGALALGRRCRR